jgi:predicted dehydrogenase
MAADPNVDMIVVSVKVPEHGQLTEPAILANKAVFVEWPLGKSLDEAEHLTKLARERNLKTQVGLQARQSPAVRKVKAMVEAGQLGQILGTKMIAYGAILGATTTEEMAYSFPIENGANLVTIPFGHAVDALCYALGEFSSLQATLAVNGKESSVVDSEGKEIRKISKSSHDFVAVQGALVNGGVASVVYQGGMSTTGKNFYWEINGQKGNLVLVSALMQETTVNADLNLQEGPMGHIQMFEPTLKFISSEKDAKLEDVEIEKAENFSYNVGKGYDAFVGIGNGHLTTFEDAVVRHRMIEAIYRSNRAGSRESYKTTY